MANLYKALEEVLRGYYQNDGRELVFSIIGDNEVNPNNLCAGSVRYSQRPDLDTDGNIRQISVGQFTIPEKLADSFTNAQAASFFHRIAARAGKKAADNLTFAAAGVSGIFLAYLFLSSHDAQGKQSALYGLISMCLAYAITNYTVAVIGNHSITSNEDRISALEIERDYLTGLPDAHKKQIELAFEREIKKLAKSCKNSHAI